MHDELVTLFDEVKARFDAGESAGAASLLVEQPPSNVAELFRSLDVAEKIILLRHFPAEQAAAVLAEVDDRSLPDLFEILQDEEIVGLLDTLPSDDAADLVGQLQEGREGRVLALLRRVDRQDAIELSELLRYPDDSAGGVMAKEYLSIREDQTLGAAISALRKIEERDLESFHYCYVVDGEGRLIGRVSLWRLLLGESHARAGDIMDRDPVSITVLADQEEVARLILKHDLLSLPVIDVAGRLVGRVTVDDAMEVLVEEATEDAARLAGVDAGEIGETSIFRSSRARLPWLLLGLFGQLMAALLLSHFEAALRARVILTFFIPLIMATGGNTGIQSSTIIIRLLVTHEFDSLRAGRHLLREIAIGLLMGVLLGGIMLGVLTLLNQDLAVGLVVGLALCSVVLIAATIGTTVPLMLHRFKVDPTVATGPFITTFNDLSGLAVYLLLSRWLLSQI
jgi:magnesium transporter